MLKEKGNLVDLEALEAYDIDLCLELNREININGEFIWIFHSKFQGALFKQNLKSYQNDK